MNSEERQAFWNTLCSLDGRDIQKDSQIIKKKIKYPKHLYRYRSVSLSSIDALQMNMLKYSHANYYDDPFDTLIHIDFEQINANARKALQGTELIQNLHNMAKSIGIDNELIKKAEGLLETSSVDGLMTGIEAYLKTNIQSLLKQNLWSVCFSQSATNETMWLKYADQYKGFCLEYDLSDGSKLLCGKQSKCENCVVQNSGTSLYPVYYSNEGYDATAYAFNLTIAYIASHHLDNSISNAIIQSLPSGAWEQERITLIKAKCHEHDEEWRMILHGQATGKVMQEWIPSGIILGLRMEQEEKQILIRSAKMAGIEKCYETYINNQYKLALRESDIII